MDKGMNLPSASFYVLLALSKGPAHGVAIADDVAAFTEGGALLGPGTLYRCLKELQESEAISRVEIDEGPGTAHRKHYALTPLGEAELRRGMVHLSNVVRVGKRRVRALQPQAQSS